MPLRESIGDGVQQPSGFIAWLGKPITTLEKFDDERSFSRLQGHLLSRGIYQSGVAKRDLEILLLRVRRRAFNRLAVLLILALVSVSFASEFTTNRFVAGGAIALSTAGGLAALLALVLRRPSDEVLAVVDSPPRKVVSRE